MSDNIFNFKGKGIYILEKIRKVNVEQLYFSYYFNWGFYYFATGRLLYKKIVYYFSNENKKILYSSI